MGGAQGRRTGRALGCAASRVPQSTQQQHVAAQQGRMPLCPACQTAASPSSRPVVGRASTRLCVSASPRPPRPHQPSARPALPSASPTPTPAPASPRPLPGVPLPEHHQASVSLARMDAFDLYAVRPAPVSNRSGPPGTCPPLHGFSILPPSAAQRGCRALMRRSGVRVPHHAPAVLYIHNLVG